MHPERTSPIDETWGEFLTTEVETRISTARGELALDNLEVTE